jgi:hypothetical protein
VKKQSNMFTDELARRNPDWKQIVAVHNDALAAEEEKVKRLVDALEQIATQTAEPRCAKVATDALAKVKEGK